MKLMKIMPVALLLSMSHGAYAQDEDLSQDAASEEEAAEVFVPSSPAEKNFFQRIQLGFVGTNVKYTNFGLSPDYNNYFLKGISLGWLGDFRIAKKVPLYFEIGATLAYHTGRSKGDSIYIYHSNVGDGEETTRYYRIQAFSVTIPVNLSYQFRNVFGMKDLTLAPFAGVYARFNVVCNRRETTSYVEYVKGNDGKGIASGEPIVSHVSKSLMSDDRNGGWWSHKPHVGKLVQAGAQAGVTVFYKNFTLGLAYMRDLTPFAGHTSSPEMTSKETKEGGNLPSIGTNCNEKVTTADNFAVTLGYAF